MTDQLALFSPTVAGPSIEDEIHQHLSRNYQSIMAKHTGHADFAFFSLLRKHYGYLIPLQVAEFISTDRPDLSDFHAYLKGTCAIKHREEAEHV